MTVSTDRWSEEMPERPGYYWWRFKHSPLAAILTVYCLQEEAKLYVAQDDRDVPLALWTGGMWAGPIEHPPMER